MPNNKKIVENIVQKAKIYLAIIAVLLIIICIYERKFILPAILIYVIVIIYSSWTDDKKKSEISKHIQELTLDVDNAAKNTLVNSPFPLAIVKTDGSIIWKNTKFVREFANVDINTYLNEIIKEIKVDTQTKKDKTIDTTISVEQKTYKVLGQYEKSRQTGKKGQKEYMMTLYFIDDTQFLEIQEKYNDAQTCIGIITVDNYEEIMQRIDTEEKPQIVASIEKELYDWAKLTGGLMVKSERETFIYVFENKYLETLEETKFDILDKIKDIKISSSIQLTLSIAIATTGENNYEKYKSALNAMDIALGRGGDQTVVAKNGKYTFFGGRTQEIEKRTKVKARVISHALEELMLASEKVIVMGHVNADIDSIGSSLGIYRFAKTIGKDCYIVNDSNGISLEKFMQELNKNDEYKNIILNKSEAMSAITKDTLLILLDTHRKSYADVPELLEETDKIVVIDHHRKSTEFIENPLLAFHEVYASSTAELVVEIIQYSEKEIELSQLEVESLYAGIMVDTKNFTFKTGVRTFEAAAYLRKYGVDIIRVKKWFQADLEDYNIIADIVKQAEIIKETIGISTYESKEKDTGIICAKAADELLTISDITASFVIGNQNDKICISGRSIGDINVQLILEKLGGGGHITLAGAQIENKTIQEVKQELIEKIDEYFEENK